MSLTWVSGIIARFPCWRSVTESHPSCHGYRQSMVTICNLVTPGFPWLPGESGREYYVSSSHRGAFYSQTISLNSNGCLQTLTDLRMFRLIWRPTRFLKIKKDLNHLFQRAANLSLREGKRSKEKVAEEYCWAITETAGRLCCGRSGSSMLESGSQLESLLRLTILYSIPTYAKLDLIPELRERKSGSVCIHSRMTNQACNRQSLNVATWRVALVHFRRISRSVLTHTPTLVTDIVNVLL
jgi:hypothetical protein